MVDRF